MLSPPNDIKNVDIIILNNIVLDSILKYFNPLVTSNIPLNTGLKLK